MVRRTVVAFALWVAAAGAAFGQGLPVGTPAAAGMAPERLARITAMMKDLVDQGRLAGTVTLVARNGKVVYHEAAGRRDIEKNVPMTTDTLFRIASMSKAVTSVAIMMLVEEGRVHLDDPVSRFIPSFAKTTVVVPPPAGTSTAQIGHERGHGTGGPPDHDSPPAHAHGRHLVRQRQPVRGRLPRRQRHRLVFRRQERAHRHDDRSPGEAADGLAAGRQVRVRLQHRHPRRGGREGQRPVACRLHEGAHLHAAQDDQHGVLRGPRAGRPPRDGLQHRARPAPPSRRRQSPARGRATTSSVRGSRSRAARASCPRHPTTRASCRCCSTAAPSTARAC